MTRPLRFGVFYAPFHPLGQNPTLALQYDLERVVELDRVGFDEAWFGEHHSGGYEIIGCPEIFIAAAAERTKHIKLGTGVVSLPYHHPWLVADRMVLLDHLTRGRVLFGTGPGALPSDAFVMGIDPLDQRRRMEESLEAILALLRSDEPVTRETDWFTMKEARLQMRPYSDPHFEVAVAAMISPSGPRLAGTYGVSLLSLSMQIIEGGFAAIGQAWNVVEEQAAAAGHAPPERDSWRVLGAMHIAETKDKAMEECTHGLKDFSNYFGTAGFVPLGYRGRERHRRTTPGQFVEELRRGRQHRHRHARRRHRLHRGAARAVGRVRHLPACSATTGPTARRRCAPTACSPGRSSRTSRASLSCARAARTTGRPPSATSCSAGPGRPSCRPSPPTSEEKAAARRARTGPA
jgi:alkanesulfonate monooxygenase SsuD/methylene tetrahydromethanopterin reductase-like flavin-dependent oxidoreductase (luciferase family)